MTKSPSKDNICILLVEADLLIRQPLAEYLRECGYRVMEAVDTDEAMTALTSDDVSIQVVLADVESTGKVDGFGLSRWVRQNAPDIRVILAASVNKAAEAAENLCENGPLLARPYDHQILIERILSEMALRTQKSCS